MNNAELLKKIVRYYHKGLNATEIAKILDLSARTCQRYIKAAGLNSKDRENAPKPIRAKAAALVSAGFTYAETARRLKVCKTTIYNWQRAARASKAGKPQEETKNDCRQ